MKCKIFYLKRESKEIELDEKYRYLLKHKGKYDKTMQDYYSELDDFSFDFMKNNPDIKELFYICENETEEQQCVISF